MAKSHKPLCTCGGTGGLVLVSIQGTSEKCFCQLRAIPSNTGKQLVYMHSVDFSVTRNTPLFQHYLFIFLNKSFQGVSCS